MGRILAIDYGSKRLGIAVSDENKKIAFAKPFIPASRPSRLLELIKNSQIESIILGIPKNLSGKETKMTKKVQDFKSWLEKNSNVPIEFVDERFTTREAARKFRETKESPTISRNVIDSFSAQILLETYLKKFRN